ncbi:uncharacterized protein LOC114663003 [Erpetoichthys calabaricus]|uniref:uncharacterized protein LOC114663003 n=1 Tax=Erpetoichthys calabaricus TaxID=27687 RepID=UPI00109FEC57|nr:uncharacterized protein LOC114663003 [Erpetoichthys calabaricus]
MDLEESCRGIRLVLLSNIERAAKATSRIVLHKLKKSECSVYGGKGSEREKEDIANAFDTLKMSRIIEEAVKTTAEIAMSELEEFVTKRFAEFEKEREDLNQQVDKLTSELETLRAAVTHKALHSNRETNVTVAEDWQTVQQQSPDTLCDSSLQPTEYNRDSNEPDSHTGASSERLGLFDTLKEIKLGIRSGRNGDAEVPEVSFRVAEGMDYFGLQLLNVCSMNMPEASDIDLSHTEDVTSVDVSDTHGDHSLPSTDGMVQAHTNAEQEISEVDLHPTAAKCSLEDSGAPEVTFQAAEGMDYFGLQLLDVCSMNVPEASETDLTRTEHESSDDIFDTQRDNSLVSYNGMVQPHSSFDQVISEVKLHPTAAECSLQHLGIQKNIDKEHAKKQLHLRVKREKEFEYISNLTKHRRTRIKRMEKDRKHQCVECGKTCSRLVNLKQHQKIHRKSKRR